VNAEATVLVSQSNEILSDDDETFR